MQRAERLLDVLHTKPGRSDPTSTTALAPARTALPSWRCMRNPKHSGPC